MTLDQQITMYAARAAVAWRNGDLEQGDRDAATATRLMDQRDRLCASVSYDQRLKASIGRLEGRDVQRP
jgi:hypothetical protein